MDAALLEPTALRAPGLYLPATLYALAQAAERDRPGGAADLYAAVANRLSELVESVRDLSVDVDEKRQLLSVVMTDRTGTAHVASALSDGTLRFLALAVMEADPRSAPLTCLEEPENGIHPERVGAVITLLHDSSTHATTDGECVLMMTWRSGLLSSTARATDDRRVTAVAKRCPVLSTSRIQRTAAIRFRASSHQRSGLLALPG